MGNLMTDMWTIRSGLETSQRMLNATSHNLTNVETEGYTRQQAISTDYNYYTVGKNETGKLLVGLGTSISCIRQLRNQFQDVMYREENGRLGFFDSQYNIVTDLESLFGEMEGASFQDSINDMWKALQELSKDPESVASKTTFVNTAVDFLTRATDVQSQINDYQIQLNEKVQETVNRINDIGEELLDLNEKIMKIEAPGIENANDLRDKRNQLLDELSYLVDIEYKESANGGITVSIEGATFVSDMSVNKMDVDYVQEDSMLLKPVWPGLDEDVYCADKFYRVNTTNAVGYLKGLVMARGFYTADYTDIPEEITEASLKGYNDTIDTSIVMTIQSQFDNLIHGIVTAINDVIAPNKEIYKFFSENSEKKIASISYDDKTIEEGSVKILDEVNAPIGADEEDTMGEALFNRRGVERYTIKEVTITYEGGTTETKKVKVYNEEDRTAGNEETLFSINNIEVNEKIRNNYSKLPLTNNKNKDEYDYDGVVSELLDIWDKDFATLTPNTLTKYNFKEYYDRFIGNIGNIGSIYGNLVKSQGDALNQIEDARENYKGVSSDEELSNLIKFQQSFNAAAKYFNTVDEMLEHVIEKLG